MIFSCQVCGTQFEAAPAAKRKYCSRDCFNSVQTKKVERTCEACGRIFLVKLHKVKEGKGKYCSRACADSGWNEPCANCGKMVHRTPNHAKRFDNAFCSRECYAEWKQDRVERVCQACGKTYETKPSVHTVYCSGECFQQGRLSEKYTRHCAECGKPFKRPKWKLFGNQLYCSNECTAKARRMPDSTRSIYNHEFTESLKEQIRKRDDRTCQECGVSGRYTRRRLAVHHIDYDKTNCHPSNLIALCDSCHSKTNYNRKYWKRRYQKLLKQRFPNY